MTLVSVLDRKLFVKKEATYGVPALFAATDAFGGPSLSIEPEAKDDQRMEALGSGSAQGFTRGMESGKWSSTCYFKPAAAGVAPDNGPMLESAFGTETVNASTSVVYTCNDNLTKPSLALGAWSTGEQHAGYGAWVEQVEFDLPANDFPKMTFSGGFALYGMAYGNVTTAQSLSGSQTITVGTTNIHAFRVGGMVTFTGHAGGYLIDSVNLAAGTFHLASNLSATVNSGDAVLAYAPSLTTAGTVLYGIDAGLTIGGVTFNFISGKVTFKTGTHGKDKEASSLRPTGSVRGMRSVDFELSFYLEDNLVGPLLGRGWNQSTQAILLRVGSNVSAQRATISMPASRWKVVPNPMPDADEHIVTMKGSAIQNAAAGDEIALTFD